MSRACADSEGEAQRGGVSRAGEAPSSSLPPQEANARERSARVPTSAQRTWLNAIEEFWTQFGYGPSLRDLCDAVGATSTNGAIEMLAVLEREGWVIRQRKVARSIRLTSLGMFEVFEAAQ